ncbi:MAG TPA: DUF1295 domain-containing protein [Polyangium sp.]|nr:DUF1295 domain-containing protein [Polyangium sp.]
MSEAVAVEKPRKVKRSKRERAEETPAIEGQIERTSDVSALTQHGWIAGVIGSIMVLVLGFIGARKNVLEKGWGLPFDTTPNKNTSAIFVLVVVAAIMFIVELVVRLRVEKGSVISMPDEIREKRYGDFFFKCVKIYVADLLVISLFWALYKSAGEYGFKRNATGGYYQPWFLLMDPIWWMYVVGGFPYILLTRALQNDPKADRKQPAFVVFKLLGNLEAWLTKKGSAAIEPFTQYDKTAVLGLFVKAFFVPLMTVFFADQFNSLVKNYSFVMGLIADGTRKPTIRESYDCALSVIFAVDVGLAWAGYVLSSRWIKNGMVSVEPTILGWLVALLCYPPFNRNPGLYFSNPGEHAFLALTFKPAIIFLASCSIASFAVYTASTVVFGLHFSNLTHRGIIQTGPYSVVRHPAYASKNFSWWCVMFPYAVYQAIAQPSWDSLGTLITHFVGLLTLTGLYYFRAITEERHLSKDPEYQDYMKKVPHRFIPGVL